MPAAIITTSQLSTTPAITALQLANHIAGVLITSSVFTQVDSYLATNEFRVFSFKYNDSSKGTAFLQLQVSSTQFVTSLYDSWNTVTKTGTNRYSVGSTSATYSLSSGISFNFTTINHPELRGVMITQGSTHLGIHGLIRPLIKPTWWDEELDLFAFQLHTSMSSNNRIIRSTTTTQLTNEHKMLANLGLSHFNTNTSSRQFMKGVLLGNDGGDFGIFAKTSDDLIMVGGDGLATGSILVKQAGVEEYMYLGSNNASPYLAIRTV